MQTSLFIMAHVLSHPKLRQFMAHPKIELSGGFSYARMGANSRNKLRFLGSEVSSEGWASF
jgi:hypothetical protein